MLFDPELVCCPACFQKLSYRNDELTCSECKRYYPVIEGIPVLLDDPLLDTKLDQLDYDDHHGITDNSRQTILSMWQTVFLENAISGNAVLEIGCGTGQLTVALANLPSIQTIHATDISQQFLKMTQNTVGDSASPVFYYACDANHLPFSDNQFDLIVANSVLHHLLDFPEVLKQCVRILKPGGCAVFFEPVLQGKIMVAFLADLMLRIHRKTGYGTLTEEDCNKIERMVKHITKSRDVGDDRNKLALMEDKYVFDLHDLQTAALNAGFSTTAHRNNPAQDNNYRFNLHQHLRMAGIDENKLKDFRFLTNAAHDMLIEMIPRDLVTPMGFFIFRK